MFDLMLTRIRELRFRYTGYHIEVPIPEDKHESLFDQAIISDLIGSPHGHNLYYVQISRPYLNLGKSKPQMLAWLDDHSPYRIKSKGFPEIYNGLPSIIVIGHQVAIQFCHPESAALFKLTWL